MNIQATTTDRLLSLYALLDTEHKDRARAEIEQIMEFITRPIQFETETLSDHTRRCAGCPGCWPQEEDDYDRLMAEIAEQDGVNNDDVDGYDPEDRF